MLMKLTGISASKGVVKGKSLVITDLTNLPVAVDGDYIVIAPFTTPTMNVILLSAKGIICETGGLTTHSAIIARELKIPCIVNAKEATSQIKNGQEIELNADIGEIIIL